MFKVSHLTKLYSLSSVELQLLLRATFALSFVGAALRILGLQGTSRFWLEGQGQKFDSSDPEKNIEFARMVERMISLAATYGPYRASCLTKSLVLIRFLRNYGMQAELSLGAVRTKETILAHAWVECCGLKLLDDDGASQHFVAFSQLKN